MQIMSVLVLLITTASVLCSGEASPCGSRSPYRQIRSNRSLVRSSDMGVPVKSSTARCRVIVTKWTEAEYCEESFSERSSYLLASADHTCPQPPWPFSAWCAPPELPQTPPLFAAPPSLALNTVKKQQQQKKNQLLNIILIKGLLDSLWQPGAVYCNMILCSIMQKETSEIALITILS